VIAGGYVKIIDLAKALAEGLSEAEKDSLFGKTAIGSYRLSV